MRKKTINLTFCAVFTAILLFLLLLSRCHGGSTAAETAGTEEPSVPVLMYHHLLKRAENTRYQGNDIVTYVEDFEQQLAWLKSNGFVSISTAQLEAYLYDNGPLPVKPVMITFDDGYLSNYIYGYPLLSQYGFTAVIFSVTGKIGETPETFTPAQINMLDRETMEKCAPVFEFASHTHNLHRATGTGHSALTDADPAVLEKDLSASLDALRPFAGSTLTVFSYPYGFYNDRVVDALKARGMRIAFRATGGHLNRNSDPYSLPRWAVSYKVSLEKFQSFFSDYVTSV